MSGETADHEPGDLANPAELLRSSGLSSKDQQAVHDAVVDGMIEGAIPDRESVQRLIESPRADMPSPSHTMQLRHCDDCAEGIGIVPSRR